MYAGVSPQQALAIYAVIAYMDSVNGVFFPKGGMHALPRALAGAAANMALNSNTTRQLHLSNIQVVAPAQ